MSKNPRILITTDTHIGHRLVARERGFVDVTQTEEHRGETVYKADTQAHDDFLADVWDNTVRPQDFIIVAGDVSINGSDYALDWHAQRPGTKILVSGNHDPVHPFHRDAHKHFEKWSKVFTGGIFPFMRRKLGNSYFLISHFPYAGTGAEGHGVEDRFTQFRLIDEGLPLLHGHTHGQEKHHLSDAGTPQLHVGLDAWNMQFVSMDTVQGWLEHPESSFYL